MPEVKQQEVLWKGEVGLDGLINHVATQFSKGEFVGPIERIVAAEEEVASLRGVVYQMHLGFVQRGSTRQTCHQEH